MTHEQKRKVFDRFLQIHLGVGLDDLPDNPEINSFVDEIESPTDAIRIAQQMADDVANGTVDWD